MVLSFTKINQMIKMKNTTILKAKNQKYYSNFKINVSFWPKYRSSNLKNMQIKVAWEILILNKWNKIKYLKINIKIKQKLRIKNKRNKFNNFKMKIFLNKENKKSVTIKKLEIYLVFRRIEFTLNVISKQ